MTSNELLYVKTIADEHSITKAAKKLHVSQPSLTQAVRRIEDELGAVLFTRTSAGTYLTATGRRYYEMAEEILNIYMGFLQDLQDSRMDIRGVLSVGASWYISTYFLTEAITSYCREYPLVDVRLTEKNTSELSEIFKQGELDLIFTHRCPFERDTLPKSLIRRSITREHLYLVAPAALELSRHAVMQPSGPKPLLDLDFIRHIPVVRFREVQRIRQLVDYALDRAQVNPPTLLYTYGFQNALELAAASDAVTFLPERFLNGPAAAGYPVEIFDVDRSLNLYWDICLCYRSQESFPPAMQRFLDLLEQTPIT